LFGVSAAPPPVGHYGLEWGSLGWEGLHPNARFGEPAFVAENVEPIRLRLQSESEVLHAPLPWPRRLHCDTMSLDLADIAWRALRKEQWMVLPDRRGAASRDLNLHTGIDAAEIGRISNAVERWGARFLDRIYTPDEQAYCGRKMQRLAGRFAAKEAISKVLGTGIRYIRWREIEILPDRTGKPVVRLHGRDKREYHAHR
jgi:holo-[acyl-carrier-protein] synthase